MVTDDRQPYELDFSIGMPYIQNDSITLYPGDRLYVEFELENGKLVNLVAVPDVRNPDRTLVIRMWQEADRPDTFLKVTNPLRQLIKYHAYMMPLAAERLSPTSSCPVPGDGRMAYEQWPQAVFQLVLVDWHTIPESDDVVCQF